MFPAGKRVSELVLTNHTTKLFIIVNLITINIIHLLIGVRKTTFKLFHVHLYCCHQTLLKFFFFKFLERPLLATNSTLSASLFPEFRLFFRCFKICLSFFMLLMMNLRSQRVSIPNLKNIADIWYYLMFSSIAIIDELLFKP